MAFLFLVLRPPCLPIAIGTSPFFHPQTPMPPFPQGGRSKKWQQEYFYIADNLHICFPLCGTGKGVSFK
jgi:hypothetical protein